MMLFLMWYDTSVSAIILWPYSGKNTKMCGGWSIQNFITWHRIWKGFLFSDNIHCHCKSNYSVMPVLIILTVQFSHVQYVYVVLFLSIKLTDRSRTECRWIQGTSLQRFCSESDVGDAGKAVEAGWGKRRSVMRCIVVSIAWDTINIDCLSL